ncbi:hypothetical protein MP228_008851 [Amoeboaphelidium protococcarum]|nr:hypothetical protein MP228_008851 [Amoeboaphelidium protococcarum]
MSAMYYGKPEVLAYIANSFAVPRQDISNVTAGVQLLPGQYAQQNQEPLFAGWLGFEVIVTIIILLGLVINEGPSNPAVNSARIEIVHTILSLHIVAKFIAYVLISARSNILVLDKRPRIMLAAFNITLTFAIFGVLVGLIIEHLDMQQFFLKRTLPQREAITNCCFFESGSAEDMGEHQNADVLKIKVFYDKGYPCIQPLQLQIARSQYIMLVAS